DAGFRVSFEQRNVEAVVGVLFVQHCYGGGEIEFAAEGGVGVSDAVESLAVAHQDAQSSLARRGWNLHRNLPQDAFAPVGSEHSFERNVVAGTGLGNVGAGAL